MPAHISPVLSTLRFSRLAEIHWLIAEMHCFSAFTDDNTLLSLLNAQDARNVGLRVAGRRLQMHVV